MLSIDVRGEVAEAVAAAHAALDRVSATVEAGALRGCGHAELTEHVVDLRRLQARAESLSLSVVREVDTRGSHLDEGLLTPAAWLRAHARMTPREASGAVRTARALGGESLRATAASPAAGEIDPAAARVIVAGAQTLRTARWL